MPINFNKNSSNNVPFQYLENSPCSRNSWEKPDQYFLIKHLPYENEANVDIPRMVIRCIQNAGRTPTLLLLDCGWIGNCSFLKIN